jgi:hypothetical protein
VKKEKKVTLAARKINNFFVDLTKKNAVTEIIRIEK